jgi:hypothetical protein
MEISRKAATTKDPADTFTGEVWVDPITRGRAVPRAVPRSDCSALDNLLAGNAPTNQLQKVRPRTPCALAAPMPQVIALAAFAALGLSGAHEPVHAGGR